MFNDNSQKSPQARTTKSTMGKKQLINWLRLIRSSNIGPTTFRQLVNRFGSAEAAMDILPELTLRGGAKAKPQIFSLEQANYELEQIEAAGARLVAIGDPDYPYLLQFIHSPPPLLSIRGKIAHTNNKTIAIIGARNASASGQKITANIAAELGEQGYLIVSGLARGIDCIAHKSTLKTGTVAVFAGGIDQIYPKENTALAEEIIENDGALISEMPFGSAPRAKDFPRRNRLVSGMSNAVLVVEAALRSGSLITARYGLEQNRDIFAIPGSPMDPRAAGTNKLIKDGAILVTSSKDILEEFSNSQIATDLFAQEETSKNNFLQESADSGPEAEFPSPFSHEASIKEQQIVFNSLSTTPIAVDDIIAATSIAAPIVQSILLELDLAGRIERSSGQLVALI